MSGRYLISFFAAAFLAWASLADAEGEVVSRLNRAGLEIGYDKGRQRFVVVGTAECELPNLSGSSFDKARNELGKVAALNARRELMQMLDMRLHAAETSEMSVKPDQTVNEVRSVIETFSKVKLTGCKTLCTAESYDRESGLYQVAVAIGWSEKSSASAGRQIDAAWSDVDDEAVYVAWCKKSDLSAMFGSRDFTAEDGLRRYVGIGSSDVEGLTGAALARAMKKAALRAKENLAYSLSIDAAAHDVAQSLVREVFDGEEDDSRQIWEKFESEVFAKCRITLKNQKEVYSATVRNPATGRRMHVSVYGVTAEK